MIDASDGGDATGRVSAPMIAGTRPRSTVARWTRRLVVLGVALANIQCLGDLVVPPSEPIYEFEAADSTLTVAAGDTISPPAVQLKVNGKLQTATIRVVPLGVTDVVSVDTVKNTVAILKTGTTSIRVKPVNSGLSTDTLHVDFTLTAIAPKAAISGPDTAYSLGDTLKEVGRATTKSNVTLSGVPLTWTVVAPDSGVASFAQIGDTARLIALKNGDITIRAQVDTGWITKMVRVRQRVARIVVSPPADSATPGKPAPTYTAQAYDSRNSLMSGVTFSWVSLNQNIATIGASSGTVTRVATGQTTVAAQSGAVTGYALVNVVIPAATPVNLWAPMSSGTTNNLNGVFGTSASNVFAVGSGGVIRRWNGTSWLTQTNSGSEDLAAVWSMSVLTYAVGVNGAMRQFDGNSTWAAVNSGTTANLSSIWASGPTGIHIGGQGRVVSNTTGTFTSQAVSGNVAGIWGASPVSATSVSSSGLALLNYDGTAWATGATLPGSGTMNAIWGLSASQMYAVGGGQVRVFNGSTWSAANVGDGNRTMNAVWGTGPNDVYLVGANGTIARQVAGGAWVFEQSGVTFALRGIWGIGSDVFVVGDNGTILRGYRGATVTVAPGTPTITTQGGTVQLTPTAKDASSATVAVSAWTYGSSDTLVATVSPTGLVTARSNGTTQGCATAPGGAQGCTTITVNIPIGPVATITISPTGATVVSGTKTFTAIARDANGLVITNAQYDWKSSNPAIATVPGLISATGVVTPVASGQTTVSASANGVTAYATVTVAMQGTAVNLWVSDASGTTSRLNGVWGASAGAVFAVGQGGVARKYNGTSWAATTTNTTTDLKAVWGAADTAVFAGIDQASSPRVLKFNGATWATSLPSGGTSGGITSVWGSAPNYVFATESGTALRLNGASWAQVAGGSSTELLRVWGTASDTIWAAGRAGSVSRWNGSEFEAVSFGTTAFDITGLWGTAPNDVYFGGGGTVRRWNGTSFSSVSTGLPADAAISGLWGTTGSDLYASSFGNGGSTYTKTWRYDGTTWSATDSVQGASYLSIWGVGQGDVILVGDNGVIRRGVRGATVTVAPANASEDLALNVSEAVLLSAAAKTSAGLTVNGATFTWTSSNPSAATVAANGDVTGVATGTTNICATAPGGAQGCVSVSVGPTVSSIVMSTDGVTLAGGNTSLTATAKDGSGNTMSGVAFQWSSLNPAIAAVNAASGVVTAVSSGQAIVSATVGNVVAYTVVTVAMAGATPVNLWMPVTSGITADLHAIWGANASDVHVGGSGGNALRFDGANWTPTATGTSSVLYGLWGAGAASVHAVALNGELRRYTSSWNLLATASINFSAGGVWGASPNEIFVAGNIGRIARFDGTNIPLQTTSTVQHLYGMWGSSRSDVYAVGANATVLRYDGATWNPVGAGVTGASGQLNDVWGTSSTDVFIAGDKIWRFNGSNWTLMSTPVNAQYNGIWGSSNSDVYAVGILGAIHRFNGTAWSEMTSGVTTTLNAVWGTRSGDVYAIGDGGVILRGVRGATLTLAPATVSLSSAGATQQMTPTLKDAAGAGLGGAPFTWTSSNTNAATVSSTGLVTAVANGSSSVCATAPGGVQACVSVTVGLVPSTVEVSPGSASLTTSPATLNATAKDAGGSAIPNSSFVWTSLNPSVVTVNAATGVVTPVASGQATIVASVGSVSGYALVTVAIPVATAVNLWVPATSPTSSELTGLWARSASDVFAVGFERTVVRYNGSTWSSIETGSGIDLRSVWGTSATNVFAAGSSGILRYDGSTWSTSHGSGSWVGVWGSSPRDVFAVGHDGAIAHYDGTAWTAQASGTSQHLLAVWGSSATDAFAVGFNGTILRYNGSVWTPMSSPTTEPLYAIWGTSGTNAFAAGLNGTVLRYSGASWSIVSSGSTMPVYDLNGSATSDLYAVGFGSQFLRFDGTNWSAVSHGTTTSAHGAVWGASGDNVWAVGSAGAILRGVRGAVISVTPETPTLTAIGATQQLTPTAKDASNNTITGVTFTWSSATPSVAAVSSSGLVTAVANGTSNVCATAPGGAQGCTTVTVSQATASVVVSPSGASVITGTAAFTASAKDSNGNTISGKTFTWNALQSNVASVNSSGLASGLSSGQSPISAQVDGMSGYATLSVYKSSTAVNLWTTLTSPTSLHVRSMWGASDSNVYAVAYDNTACTSSSVLHFNGQTWSSIYTTPKCLAAVWGSGPGAAWVAGSDNGTSPFNSFILPFSGTSAGAPVSVGADNYVTALWGASPTNIYVNRADGEFTRFNGSSGTLLSNQSGNSASIWGTASDSVYVSVASSRLLRWNGTSLVNLNANPPFSMNSIWGTAGSNIFGASQGGVYRYNGAAWTTSQVIPNTMNGVHGTSASDVYAVGTDGEIWRFDGSSWSAHSGATVSGFNMTEDLNTVWGTNDGSMLVGGNDGFMMRGYRGATVSLAPATPTLTSLNATQQLTPTAKTAGNATISTAITYVWSSTNTAVATVNSSGLVTAIAQGSTTVCATARGGAQGCTTVTVAQAAASVTVTPGSASMGAGNLPLSATASDANGNAISGQAFTWSSMNTSVATVSAGGVVSPVTSGQVAIAATAGSATGYAVVTISAPSAVTAVNLWAPVTSPTGQDLWDVWAADASQVFAVGNNGVVLRYNGTSWATIDSGNVLTLRGVTGTSATDVITVGADNHIRRYNGSTWSDMSVTQADYTGVWAAAPNYLLAVGVKSGFGRNYVARSTGSTWSKIDSLDVSVSSQAALGIWGTSTANYVTTAEGGLVRRWNGATWSQSTITNADLFGIWGSAVGDIYIAAGNGPGSGVFKSTDGGQNWSVMSASPGSFDIWGTSANELFVASVSLGRVAQYNGTSWTDYDLGTGANYRAITGTSNGDVWAVGIGGRIARGVRGGSVTVTPSTSTLNAFGATQQMSATAKDASNNTISGVTYTWSSSDPSKATVSSSGVVTAVANGVTNVCATAPGGAQGCSTVTVSQVTASIVVSPNGGSVNAGSTTPFTATAKDANGNAISGVSFAWHSMNLQVATVDVNTGVVTGVNSGQAPIRALVSGVQGYGTVTVAAPAVTPVNLWYRTPSPTGQMLRGAWAARKSEVYAVGNEGVVVRYNGSSWSRIDSGFVNAFFTVSGSDETDVLVAGSSQVVRRYNGSSWNNITSTTNTSLNAVWESSPSSGFAAGSLSGGTTKSHLVHFEGTSGVAVDSVTGTNVPWSVWGTGTDNVLVGFLGGSIRRWNGSTWTSTSLSSATVRGIWGVSSTELYAAVEDNGIYKSTDGGQNWTQLPLPAQACCLGVWASSSSEVFAVEANSVVARYNGISWTETNVPAGTYAAVAGTSNGDVWYVGNSGRILRGVRGATVTATPGSLTLPIGNAAQLAIVAKDAASNEISDLISYTNTSSNSSVATVDPNGIVTGLAEGTANIIVAATGGAADTVPVNVVQVASVVVSPSNAQIASGTTTFTATAKKANGDVISGVTFTWSSTNGSVAGINTSSGQINVNNSGQTTVVATTGGVSGYALVTVAKMPAQPINLWASVTTGASGAVTAVWGANDGQVFIADNNGAIRRYNGSAWSSSGSFPGVQWQGLWGTGSDDVYAVGDNGYIAHYNGTFWTQVGSGVTSQLLSKVWGTAPNDVYAVGNNGTVVHYDGSSWTADQPLGATSNYRGIWGTAADNMRVVGWGDAVLRKNGSSSWSAETVTSSRDYYGIWGSSNSDVHIAATLGATQKYNGSTWAPQMAPASFHNYGVHGTTPSDAYLASGATDGSTGLITRYNGTGWQIGSSASIPKPVDGIWIGQDYAYAVGDNATVYRGHRGSTIAMSHSAVTFTSYGAQQQLTATAKDASDNTIAGVTFTWSSSDPNVAPVSSNGLVTADGIGTTSVCATAPGGAQGCTTITVTILSFSASLGNATASSSSTAVLNGLTISGLNNLLVCVVASGPVGSGITVASVVADDGVGGGSQSLTQLGSYLDSPGGGTRWSTWYLAGAQNGSGRRALATLSAATDNNIACVTYVGVNQSTPFGTVVTTSGNSGGNAQLTLTSNLDGSLAWGHLISSSFGAVSGIAVRQAGIVLVDGSNFITNGNAHTFTWSWSNDYYAHGAMIRPVIP